MIPKDTALVLEGGGLRGVYTSGVLRYFMDRNLRFPYVIGVSMGACNGANYVSLQPERNRIVNIRYANDRRYLSYTRLLLGGELFGMRFLFDSIPNKLVPFDFETFRENEQRFVAGATDCETGEPVYFDKDRPDREMMTVLRASCSLPFLAPPVFYQGRFLMDGGISDSIPVEKSIADGFRKQVVVLTQPRGYRKKTSVLAMAAKYKYCRFPGLCRAIAGRADQYNATVDSIESLEAKGKAFVVRPDRKLAVGRFDRDKEKLYAVYDEGYFDAFRLFGRLRRFLEKGTDPI